MIGSLGSDQFTVTDSIVLPVIGGIDGSRVRPANCGQPARSYSLLADQRAGDERREPLLIAMSKSTTTGPEPMDWEDKGRRIWRLSSGEVLSRAHSTPAT